MGWSSRGFEGSVPPAFGPCEVGRIPCRKVGRCRMMWPVELRGVNEMRAVPMIAVPLALGSVARPEAIDKQVSDSRREVHDRGRELYNAGDAAGGYRMYQGGLLVARGILVHRPDVQRLITDGLVAAEREPSVA